LLELIFPELTEMDEPFVLMLPEFTSMAAITEVRLTVPPLPPLAAAVETAAIKVS